MLEDKRTHIYALVHAIINYLKINEDKSTGASLALERLVAMNLCEDQIIDTPSVGTRHEEILSKAIRGINNPALEGIAKAFRF
jgi:hypothetical protein